MLLIETHLGEATDAELSARIARAFEERRVPEREKPSREIVERQSSPRGSLQRKLVKCGNEGCKKCAEGPAHGPYWYHYFHKDGRLVSRYVGKQPKEEHRELSPGLFASPETG